MIDVLSPYRHAGGDLSGKPRGERLNPLLQHVDVGSSAQTRGQVGIQAIDRHVQFPQSALKQTEKVVDIPRHAVRRERNRVEFPGLAAIRISSGR